MGRPKGSKNGVLTLVWIDCERCGTPFSRRPGHAPGAKYCSRKCYRPPRPDYVCETCGKSYPYHASVRGRFCSSLCKRNRVQKCCPECGKTFEPTVSKAAKFNYCSIGCRRIAAERARVKITCETCGKHFERVPSQPVTGRYCSNECLYARGRATIVCAYCGKERTVKKYRAEEGQRCCSNRCATLLRMRDGFEPGDFGNKRRSGYRTDIERLTEAVLLELNIIYLFEHKVSRYSVDFALPLHGIALECDGWQHLTLEGREHDKTRDAFLESQGWRVVHVLDREIRTDAGTAIRRALGIKK